MASLSKQQAEKIVRDIRSSKRMDDPEDENTKDLDSATILFFEQLDSTVTHFVRELVQNADDNKYDRGVIPKLVFLYRDDGYLWVGCNERGFTGENVRSICGIHRSTKGVENAEKVSIGEKGIGFKSVFKVADKVWISSEPFTFRFDRDAFLGPIAPTWDEDFPKNPLLNEKTMFCLRIPEADNQNHVVGHLHAIELELPIFLRNIAQIQVIFSDSFNNVKQDCTIARESPGTPRVDFTLVKHDNIKKEEETLLRLAKVEHIAENMPYEKRRNGVQRSKLQILFPVTKGGQPEIKNRCVYNYLPVRAYGLPFLLNADFLLSANRENVEHNKMWNNALLAAAVELFVLAVHRFNREGIAKHTWPMYLKYQGPSDSTVFTQFLNDTIERLRKTPVLESQAGSLTCPQDLTRISGEFMDDGDPQRPLIGDLATFLSTAYHDPDLSSLVVNKLDENGFFGFAKQFYHSKANQLMQYSPDWHAQVAKTIHGKVSPTEAKTAKLVPLRDGTWVEAENVLIFFPELNEGLAIPQGIDIAIVRPEFASNGICRALYTWLGVKNLSPQEACTLIIQHHGKCNTNSYGGWSLETVISHAWHLFKASKNLSLAGLDELRLAVKNSTTLQKGSVLYIQDSTALSVATLVPQSSSLVQYIDPAYLNKVTPAVASEFIVWLKDALGVGTIPRIITDDKKAISAEFDYILRNVPSRTFLDLLKTHWEGYSDDVRDYPAIRDRIASSYVRCTDGANHSLDETVLPTASILKAPCAEETLPLLDVDDPANSQWSMLGIFGVSTTPDVAFFIRLLLKLAQSTTFQPTQDDVALIYEQIQSKSFENIYLVKKAFEEPVVLVVTATTYRWAKLSECVWQAPLRLLKSPTLSTQYPKVERLFVGYLQLQNGSVTDMVDELISYDNQASKAADIKNLLEALSDLIDAGNGNDSIDRLLDHVIFPIRKPGFLLQLGSAADSGWYIADTSRLRDCFEDKLPLLDFDVQDLVKLEPLLKRLYLLDRRLSKKVKEETISQGSVELSIERTDEIRMKARYIARTVPKESQHFVFQQLSNIQVFCTENLILRRTVPLGPSTSATHDDTRAILMSTRPDGSPSMFLNGTDVSSGHLPIQQIGRELCAYFDLDTDDGKNLEDILSMRDEKQIQDMLERAKFAGQNDLAEEVKDVVLDNQEPAEHAPTPLSHPQSAKPIHFESPLRVPGNSASTPPSTSRRSGASRRRQHRQKQFIQIPATLKQPQASMSAQPTTSFSLTAHAIRIAANSVKTEHIIDFNGSKSSSGNAPASSAPHGGQITLPPSTPKSADIRSATSNRDSKSRLTDPGDVEQTLPGFVFQGQAGNSRQARISNVPQEPQRIEHDNELIAAGQAFVYEWMKSKFRIRLESWTSNARTRFGYPTLTHFEGDYADITIKGGFAAVKVRRWLEKHGYQFAGKTASRKMTFNIVVKTTAGSCNDRFSLSNNQIYLIRRWHDSPTDVCVLLRVFDFNSTAKMKPYLDPFGMYKAGELNFQPQGFWVQPT